MSKEQSKFESARRVAQNAFRELPNQPAVFRSGRLQVVIASCAICLVGRGKLGFILAIFIFALACLFNAMLGLILFVFWLFVRPRAHSESAALRSD